MEISRKGYKQSSLYLNSNIISWNSFSVFSLNNEEGKKAPSLTQTKKKQTLKLNKKKK